MLLHLTYDQLTVLEAIVVVCLAIFALAGMMDLVDELMLKARERKDTREQYESHRDTLNFCIHQIVNGENEDDPDWLLQTALYELRQARRA